MLTVFADVTPLSAVFLGVGVAGVVSIPALLFADAHRTDFDPRPAVRRAVESGRFDAALIAVPAAKHAAHRAAVRVQRAPLDAALSAAALLALLLPASPEGARS
ncbi:hypothetical protein PV755_46360 [Streptomyces caniscabiei]|uniref:hypothetical protein n=1 Tax=Streptomyces caniscabiei TaxID=2746961 RepID=UPI0029A89AB8|nr:hypothetical protein [Streptomyces caniscabiei]MDX3516229.1 hypothetical protein [Streptomyces caniscabiei]MDX3724875.1 hypothetical protein [Streptomyces caniscabiei]